MKTFENIVIIYPEDPTIDFLYPLFNVLSTLFPNRIIRPKYGDSLHTMVDDDTQLIIFIGHGTPNGLYGGVNDNGQKQLLCDIPSAINVFKNCSLVLFSCNSNDYIKKLRSSSAQINNYIAFGDMPTDWTHITHYRDNNANYWTECNTEQLEYYKKTIVESVLAGFHKAYNTNSFYGFFKGLSHIVNVKINNVIMHNDWSKEIKLQLVERLIEFKRDIKHKESIN